MAHKLLRFHDKRSPKMRGFEQTRRSWDDYTPSFRRVRMFSIRRYPALHLGRCSTTYTFSEWCIELGKEEE